MNHGRERIDSKNVSKDPFLANVALRLERWNMSGYTAAIGIARLLGQDEIVALLSEDIDEERPPAPFPAVKAYPEMVDGSMNMAAELRLREVSH